MTKVNFPSVTVCNENGLDSGEYVRNVFNNLAFTGSKSSQLKEGFKGILDDLTVDLDEGRRYVEKGDMYSKFLEQWLRDSIKLSKADTDYLGLEEILRGKFMTHADNHDEWKLKSQAGSGVMAEIEFLFGAMMRGEDFLNELMPYLPIKIDKKLGQALEREVEWEQSFMDLLDQMESARKCMIFTVFCLRY